MLPILEVYNLGYNWLEIRIHEINIYEFKTVIRIHIFDINIWAYLSIYIRASFRYKKVQFSHGAIDWTKTGKITYKTNIYVDLQNVPSGPLAHCKPCPKALWIKNNQGELAHRWFKSFSKLMLVMFVFFFEFYELLVSCKLYRTYNAIRNPNCGYGPLGVRSLDCTPLLRYCITYTLQMD